VTDECLSIAAVGLEHLERLVAGDIRDLDQVRAALDCRRNEAGAQRMAAEGRMSLANSAAAMLFGTAAELRHLLLALRT
jgi:hypothetical protein